MTPNAALADRELQVKDLYASARCDFGTFVELAFRSCVLARRLFMPPISMSWLH